jgi:hypothetical protein
MYAMSNYLERSRIAGGSRKAEKSARKKIQMIALLVLLVLLSLMVMAWGIS